MKIGLSSLFLINRSFKELAECIVNSGVRNWEIVDEGNLKLDKRRVGLLREIGNSYDVGYSVHAPFADMNIASFDDGIRGLMMRKVQASLANAHELGASLFVLHPGLWGGIRFAFEDRIRHYGLESIRAMVRQAEELGLTLALENMPSPLHFMLETPEDFKRLFGEVDSRILGITFDVGHANTQGSVEEFVDKFMDRIVHVHAHDNDGSYDAHLSIGDGNIDWPQIMKRLVEGKFNGTVVLETIENPTSDLDKLKRYVR